MVELSGGSRDRARVRPRFALGGRLDSQRERERRRNLVGLLGQIREGTETFYELCPRGRGVVGVQDLEVLPQDLAKRPVRA